MCQGSAYGYQNGCENMLAGCKIIRGSAHEEEGCQEVNAEGGEEGGNEDNKNESVLSFQGMGVTL